MSKQTSLFPWLFLSALVIVLDQISKTIVSRMLHHGDSRVIVDHLNLVLSDNPGVAFGLLAQFSGWQRYPLIALGIGATLFMLYLLVKHSGQKMFSFALAMIIGGALGNVIDRILHGHVIDFLDFYIGDWHWPAFNVADSAITLGAVLLVLDELRRVRRSK